MTRRASILKRGVLPIFAPLCLSLAIWWEPEFFSPDSFRNLGDSVFPFHPRNFIDQNLSAWMPRAGEGFGAPNYLPIPGPFFVLAYALDFLGLPLWLINRLWFVIPKAFVGWGTYFLFRSLYPGKTSSIPGVLASLFPMVPFEFVVAPVWDWSLSGFAFGLGAYIRMVASEKIHTGPMVLFGLSIMCLILNARNLYLFALFIFLYTVGILFVDRNLILNRQFLSKLFYSLLIILGVNAYWIVPFLSFGVLKNWGLAEMMEDPRYGESLHRSFLMSYQDILDPLWVLRLKVSGMGSMKTFVNQPFIYPLTFILPAIGFSALWFWNRNRLLKPFFPITVLFLSFALAMQSEPGRIIYRYFFDHLPGFSMLNGPRYWITVLTILYAVLIGTFLHYLFESLNKRVTSNRTFSVLHFGISAAILLLIILVQGGGLLQGSRPDDSLTPFGNSFNYTNRVSGASIPEDYTKLARYLSQHAEPGHRVLNLPYVNGGYASYKWWHEYNMPEITAQLTSVPFTGINDYGLLQKAAISESFSNEAWDRLTSLLQSLGFRFVLLHKDYFPIKNVFNFSPFREYKNPLDRRIDISTQIDNDSFVLYTVTDPVRQAVYALSKQENLVFGEDGIINPDLHLEETFQQKVRLFNSDQKKICFLFKDKAGEEFCDFQQGGPNAPPFLHFTHQWPGNPNYDRRGNLFARMDMSSLSRSDPSSHISIPAEFKDQSRMIFPFNAGPNWFGIKSGRQEGNRLIFEFQDKYQPSDTLNFLRTGDFIEIDPKTKRYNYLRQAYIKVKAQSGGVSLRIPVQVEGYELQFAITPPLKQGIGYFWKNGRLEKTRYSYDHETVKIEILGSSLIEGDEIEVPVLLKRKTDPTGGKIYLEINPPGTGQSKSLEDLRISTVGDPSLQYQTLDFLRKTPSEFTVVPPKLKKYYLILNETFHPLWKCYLDGKEIVEHSASLMGLNVWQFDGKEGKEIRILFTPEPWFVWGRILTLGFWCFLGARFAWKSWLTNRTSL